MKNIYLILAHHQPEQLVRTIKALEDQTSYFVVHLDNKSDIDLYTELPVEMLAHLHFIESRVSANWGSFGLIEATLNGLEYIRLNFDGDDRVNLISGQDYPIKKTEVINKFFLENRNKIFIEFYKLPNNHFPLDGVMRFPKFEEVDKIYKLFGGSQWWSATVKTIDLIFDFLTEKPSFIKYFRLVAIPDESFFQTIIMNHPNNFIQDNIINNNLRFIEWEKDAMHPTILEEKHYSNIVASKHLFARKFDSHISLMLLNQLDLQLLNAKS